MSVLVELYSKLFWSEFYFKMLTLEMFYLFRIITQIVQLKNGIGLKPTAPPTQTFQHVPGIVGDWNLG